MSAQQQAGAYEPRLGDQVVVRRYIVPTTGKRTLHSERVGEVTNVHPERDGYRIWLDGDPEWVFTGYQFLGAGINGHNPASLVTEVALAKGAFDRQVSPDLAVVLDASQCIVLVVINPRTQEQVRTVTVGDVDAFKAALDDARTVQLAVLDKAESQRITGRDDRRRSEGRLTQSEAVEWLIGRGYSRGSAVRAAGQIRTGRGWPGKQAEGMTYEGTYWTVPANTEQTAR